MVDKDILQKVQALADKHELRTSYDDLEKPWGGYLAFDESQAKEFAAAFFPDLDISKQKEKMRPKFLIFKPNERLSWQYHQRRWEIWRAIWPIRIVVSDTDAETEPRSLAAGESIKFTEGQRHRNAPTDNWGLAAEIWFHTDPDNPSEEDDVIRLQDDYNRPKNYPTSS